MVTFFNDVILFCKYFTQETMRREDNFSPRYLECAESSFLLFNFFFSFGLKGCS